MSLAERMLAAADTLDELNALYDLGQHCPWTPVSLREEAPVVASETER